MRSLYIVTALVAVKAAPLPENGKDGKQAEDDIVHHKFGPGYH